MPNCRHAVSKAAWNSLPPSTWIALMGKGNRRRIEPRNCAARLDVARVCTSITSHLETTSRAVKCLSTTPGRGRISRVSTCTMSPGFMARYSLGLRIA